MSPVATTYDTSQDDQREEGLQAAAQAISAGRLVVVPTDTVYGVAADAFDPTAVQGLLDAKGRGREMPPPVLISASTTVDALAVGLPTWARSLAGEYWPGALTLVCHQQPSLTWDLGETKGTVAIRMPQDEVALALMSRTGPLAVSSANLSGHEAARTAAEAHEMLGDRVEVILDAGTSPGAVASTIVDCTGPRPYVLREGALGVEELRTFLAGVGTDLEVDRPGA